MNMTAMQLGLDLA